MSASTVYEAHDEDWDEQGVWIGDSAGGDAGDWEGEGEGGSAVEWADEGAEDDDFGSGVTVVRRTNLAEDNELMATDLSLDAYLDPLALVNAWEGALTDFKFMHPDRFLPPTEAPLSLVQRQTKAPIWYGPPPSAASTSKLPPQPPVQTVSSSTSALANGHTIFREPSVTPSDSPAPGTKKRKRLTGSQKKARKAAKLAAATTATGGDEDESAVQEEDVEAQESRGVAATAPFGPAAPHSPTYTPTSPKISRAPHLFSPPIPPPAASTSASTSRTPLGPQHPSSFTFVVPPVSSLPTTFPPPPPIAPLTGDEPALEAETPEALLEAALWSWYTAGYQTALYHAAVGVAKFKPSADESS
ncbi:SMN domain-containing protein [Rhodotorula toruloides]|uniref:Uncharacterized protein n=1 Tax=Rhodotorula toruloides TaxID=5286 RepID=A0A0K3CFR7_RHOTO|nr:SMN domain-containing protein [Rhodotorula toruloides]PRQ74283.1 hypothetical protein AAT19DRAFT_14636 [Rhodotorula toruloides]